jgi:predicted  nucleic acid-binding Zn-ribbon protein
MSDIPERLLTLQSIDTELDQLARRRTRLPEHQAAVERRDEVMGWEKRAAALRSRLDELEAAIETAEQKSAEAQQESARLEAQLKTVIAPREAEALMSEIGGATARRDESDLAAIAALEEQAAVDDELTAHVATEPVVRAALASAAADLEAALGELEREESALRGRAENARAGIPEAVLQRYTRVRESQGVAVARLNGKMCEGCHLDLSAAEVDEVRAAAAASGVTDCPQCGRMLVV